MMKMLMMHMSEKMSMEVVGLLLKFLLPLQKVEVLMRDQDHLVLMREEDHLVHLIGNRLPTEITKDSESKKKKKIYES